MFKIIKICGLTVYDKKRYKGEFFAEELADLAYRNGTPSDWLLKTVLKEFEDQHGVLHPILPTNLLLVEPLKGRKYSNSDNGDVHLSLLTEEKKDFGWIKILSKDIIEMSYDDDERILMVTTFKKKNKIFYMFRLENPLDDLSEFWESKYHPRKFNFQDFLKNEKSEWVMGVGMFVTDTTKGEMTNHWDGNELLKLYILFVQDNPSVTTDSFRRMLSETGGMKKVIELSPSSHEHILRMGRHRCTKCSRWCVMKCSSCLAVMYCDVDCQKSDWIFHQKDCEDFTKNLVQINKIYASFEKYLQDRMNTSICLTFKSFKKRLRRKIYHDDFNSRAIEFFPEEIPKEVQKLDDVD